MRLKDNRRRYESLKKWRRAKVLKSKRLKDNRRRYERLKKISKVEGLKVESLEIVKKTI